MQVRFTSSLQILWAALAFCFSTAQRWRFSPTCILSAAYLDLRQDLLQTKRRWAIWESAHTEHQIRLRREVQCKVRLVCLKVHLFPLSSRPPKLNCRPRRAAAACAGRRATWPATTKSCPWWKSPARPRRATCRRSSTSRRSTSRKCGEPRVEAVSEVYCGCWEVFRLSVVLQRYRSY